MPCISIPLPPIPTLPNPLRLTAETPPFDAPKINFCCKLPPIPVHIPPQKLPALLINSAVLAALKAALEQVQTYLDSIPLECPKE